MRRTAFDDDRGVAAGHAFGKRRTAAILYV